MSVSFSQVRLPLAVAVAVGGASWALWVVFKPEPRRMTSSVSRSVVVAAPPPPLHLPEPSGAYTAEAITESCSGALQSAGEPFGKDMQLASSAGKLFEYLLHPTLEQLEKQLQERGDKNRVLDESTPKQKEEYFRTVTQGLAGKTADFTKLETRVRYRDGQQVHSKEDAWARMVRTQTGDAALKAPETCSLTAVEFIFRTPIQTNAKGEQKCRIGMLFGKTKDRPNWAPIQVKIYDLDSTICMFHPVF